MRLMQFTVPLITVILFCSIACAFTASYEQTTSGIGKAEPGIKFVKIKDDKIRIEMDTPDGKGIAIIDKDMMLSYIPSQNKAIKVKIDVQRDMNVLSDYGSYLESIGAKIIGSERIDSYDCEIYDFIDPRINMPSKVWLWKEKKFPVKVEIKSPNGVVTTTMKNIKVDIPIDDSEFTLPAGIEIVEESEMAEQ